MKYTVYILRHGRTWFNTYDKMQGWSDSPLTTEGTAVAERAAQQLKDVPFDLAISSDARRAIDTCRLITSANVNHQTLIPQKSPRFREEFYGYFEGMNSTETWHMVLAPHGFGSFNEAAQEVGLDQTKDWMKAADPFHDAEDAHEYWQRLEAGFNDLDQLAFDGAKILLVSHGTTIRSLAERFGDGSFEVTTGPQNSSLTTLVREDGQNVVTSYNQTLDNDSSN
ncbi:histidine phosphatase family protein [Bombilactobacillus folatiphilus]|uniref:phosphoglycerate mutase (2,3-diphosphoglycerate-dependent) n=1 Tax=Bombilactobacillus folatiphilus TaxID=2923362 RepID=A0ABY4P9P2_9LACO|nr:histidine phosphatase family protein [Bombilactobacillus folatiphilus]UQS82251.1 histidine phosphatase family protein [Bombilactobacillus folatiphilus]